MIALLSGRTLDDEAVREKTDALETALREPEEWMLDFDPETIRQLTVEMAIIDYVLIGDKIDELHELISDEFAEPLKPFPYREDNEKSWLRIISRGSTKSCRRGPRRGNCCPGTMTWTTICMSSSSTGRIPTGSSRWPIRWACG